MSSMLSAAVREGALELSYPQFVYLDELKTKFRSYVGGFGSGKTYVGCMDLLLFALANPGAPQGYFGPSYPSIRDIFYPTIEEAAFSLGLRCDIKTSDKEVHLYRGKKYYGVIICRSMDRPGSIIGFKIARALVDEIDTLPMDKARDAWRKIIARLRYVIDGVVNGVGCTTTPEGFKFAYELFGNEPTESYSMVQASTYENEIYLPPDYIPSLKETYPAELIDAYIKGLFCNLTSGTVYRQFDRRRNGSRMRMMKGEELHCGIDFNVGKMSVKAHVKRENGWHQVSEIDGAIDTPSTIALMKARWQDEPRRIVVYPDASGKHRSTRGAGATESDIGLLRAAGFDVRAKESNPPVRDRYISVNKVFEDRKLWVNVQECPVSTRCLEQQAFDKNGEPDKEAGFDHSNDATGYFCWWHFPIVKPLIHTNIGRAR